MNYEADVSGAYELDVPNALVNNFDYMSSGVTDYNRLTFPNLIDQSLSLKMPILYFFSSNKGRHAVVVDGLFSSTDMHINMGWGGADDDWYFIEAPLNYIFDHTAIFNIKPWNKVEIAVDSAPTMTLASSAVGGVASRFRFTVYNRDAYNYIGTVHYAVYLSTDAIAGNQDDMLMGTFAVEYVDSWRPSPVFSVLPANGSCSHDFASVVDVPPAAAGKRCYVWLQIYSVNRLNARFLDVLPGNNDSRVGTTAFTIQPATQAGSIKVTVVPTWASGRGVNDVIEWHVEGGTSKKDGDIVGALCPGQYRLQVAGTKHWLAPNAQWVNIVANATKSYSVTCAAMLVSYTRKNKASGAVVISGWAPASMELHKLFSDGWQIMVCKKSISAMNWGLYIKAFINPLSVTSNSGTTWKGKYGKDYRFAYSASSEKFTLWYRTPLPEDIVICIMPKNFDVEAALNVNQIP